MEKEISSMTIPLFQEIRSNHSRIHDFAYYLEYLAFHMPDRMLVPSLLWLIKNKLTGQKFLDFMAIDCKNSGLELIRYLTMKLEHDRQLRSLTVKDIQ